MERSSGSLTIFFEEPFWVGVFERIEDGRLSAAKVVFGAEPSDCEVAGFIRKYYGRLRFSPEVTAAVKQETRNPKRLQREVKRQMRAPGIGTRSQQALQLQREQFKLERKADSRKQKEARKRRLFEQKQQQKKEKHRGR